MNFSITINETSIVLVYNGDTYTQEINKPKKEVPEDALPVDEEVKTPQTTENVKVDEEGTKRHYRNDVLHRDGDLPAVEYSDGSKCWYRDGELHREGDKPAIEIAEGTKHWYKNGLPHRDDNKPAKITENGILSWCKNGTQYFPNFN